MTSRLTWARLARLVGHVALLVGALDPLEGSVAILAGAVLVALGLRGEGLDPGRRRHVLCALALIAVGVGAVWGLSFVGGIGGRDGQALAWGLLIVPYPVGWCLLVLGPGAPRWVRWGGFVVGVFYVALPVFVFLRSGRVRPETVMPLAGLGVCGLLLITWVGWRERRRGRPEEPG